MALRIRVEASELPLVHEALGYMSRRIRRPEDARVLSGLIERTERLVLSGESPAPARLVLTSAEAWVLRMVLEGHAAALSRPFSDLSNRQRVARLREIDRRLQRAGSWWGRLCGWLGGG